MGIPKHWDRLKSGDHFTFTVELVREDDSIVEQLAGANNVDAAQAAFETLPRYYGERDILRIRQGSRIMNRVHGTDEDRKALLARMRGKQDG